MSPFNERFFKSRVLDIYYHHDSQLMEKIPEVTFPFDYLKSLINAFNHLNLLTNYVSSLITNCYQNSAYGIPYVLLINGDDSIVVEFFM